MLTNPDFAKLYDFKIPSDKIRVRAAAFNCGHFYFEAKDNMNPMEEASLIAYFGPDWREKLPLVDTLKYITPGFPPSFVMTAQYDFLKEQALVMCRRLEEQGVSHEYRLYGAEGQNYMAHVFHLNIRLPEAEACNAEECGFFLSVWRGGSL